MVISWLISNFSYYLLLVVVVLFLTFGEIDSKIAFLFLPRNFPKRIDRNFTCRDAFCFFPLENTLISNFSCYVVFIVVFCF